MNDLSNFNNKSLLLITEKLPKIQAYAQLVHSAEGFCPERKIKTASGWITKKDTIAEITLKLIAGFEAGLSLTSSLQDTYIINKKVTIYGDALLALALTNPLCEYIKETFDDETMTATCRVKRKNHPEHIVTFSLEDAKAAGLLERKYDKDGPWQNFTKRMLTMRARSWGVRDKFADVLKGFQCTEEVMDYPEEEEKKFKDIKPKKEEPVIYIPSKKEEILDVDVDPEDIPEPEEAEKLKTARKNADEKKSKFITSEQVTELQTELLRRELDIDGFYNHYEISTLEEFTPVQFKKALARVKKKPLKEIVEEGKSE